MNAVKCYLEQQLGFKRWTTYNTVFKRYSCFNNYEFGDIFGQSYSVMPETPIFACKFSTSEGYEHLVALANEAGVVILVDTSKKGFTRSGGYAHGNAIFDIAWIYKSRRILTASGDHSAIILDMSKGSCTIESAFIGHTRSLKAVASCEENPNVFATGGRDSLINIWDARVNSNSHAQTESELYIPNAHLNRTQIRRISRSNAIYISASNSVTGLIFQDQNTLISCGAGDGFIKVWDMRKTFYAKDRAPVSKYMLPYAGTTLKNGFSHLAIDYDRNILYASCLDNVIYSYNIGTYNTQPIMRYHGHENRTYYVKMCLSPDGRYIISGSSDNNAYIWQREQSLPMVKLIGHDAEVTGVGWNSRDLLVTCSDDLKHKFWSISQKELSESEKELDCRGYAVDFVSEVNKEDDENNDLKKECPCVCKAPTPKRMTTNSSYVREPLQKVDCNSVALDDQMNTNSKKRLYEPDPNESDPNHTFNSYRNSADTTPVYKKPRTETVSSLLSDLPVFGLDENAPHLHVSPMKTRELDWLTKLRHKLAATSIRTETEPISSCNEPPSPTKPVSSNKPHESRLNSPLLRYIKVYKVTNSRTSTSKPFNVLHPSVPQTSSQ